MADDEIREARRGIGTLYHSGHILSLAMTRALSDSNGEVSIILSAVALEGFLNEFAHSASRSKEDSEQVLGRLLATAEEEHAQPRFKLQLAHFAITGKFLDRGAKVLQDFESLLWLRNSLVHLKPISSEWSMDDDIPPKELKDYPAAIRHLLNTKVIEMPSRPSTTWHDIATEPRVAKWAYNVVIRTMNHLFSVLPTEGYLSRMLGFRLEGRDELPL
jgi:hypothetical protein